MLKRVLGTLGLLIFTLIWVFTINPADAKQDKYVRWSKDSLPLKVYIEKDSSTQGFKSTYPVTVAKAFRQWKVDSGGLVDFTIVNNKADADIQFVWADKMKKQDVLDTPSGHSFVWGVTKIGKPTTITLATKHPLNDNQPLSESVIYMISLHEIGHALGLWWHTTDPYDIMYPNFIVPSTTSNGTRLIANENKGTLSKRDIQNLISLYKNNNTVQLDKLALGTQIKMPAYNGSLIGDIETTGTAAATVATKTNKLNVNLGEALARLKQDPNSFEAYNNIGLVYLENKNYPSAIEAFKKSLSINKNYAKAHFNLAICYVKIKKYYMAIEQYENYLKIDPESPHSDNVKREIDRLKKVSYAY